MGIEDEGVPNGPLEKSGDDGRQEYADLVTEAKEAFGRFSPSERLVAMLAAIETIPVPKEMALEYAQIKLDDLSPSEQEKVERTLEDAQRFAESTYQLSTEAKIPQELEARLSGDKGLEVLKILRGLPESVPLDGILGMAGALQLETDVSLDEKTAIEELLKIAKQPGEFIGYALDPADAEPEALKAAQIVLFDRLMPASE